MRLLSWFNLRRFEEPPEPKPGDPPEPKPEPKPDDKPDPKTFTQEDIDRIVSDRLKRQKEQFGDYDDLKKKAAEFDKLDEASKTELQKAQDAAAKAEADKIAAEQRETENTARANEKLIKAEVKAAAAGRFIDADAVIALIDRTDIKVSDDDSVTGVAEALDKLAADKPHLVTETRPRGNGDGGARGGGDDGKPDYRKSEKDEFASELAKHGLRPRS